MFPQQGGEEPLVPPSGMLPSQDLSSSQLALNKPVSTLRILWVPAEHQKIISGKI